MAKKPVPPAVPKRKIKPNAFSHAFRGKPQPEMTKAEMQAMLKKAVEATK